MIVVIYATYLYSSPDRRSSSSQVEYREVKEDDEESRDFERNASSSADAEKENYDR